MIQEKAYAKLNISLDISGIRADGYHELVMVMQTIDITDSISIERNDSNTITSESNFTFLPTDEKNLAVKAAKLFLEKIGKNDEGVHITLQKEIPTGAGMAGGSADAAAVLRAMNKAHDNVLSEEELLSVAGMVGSDVPYCTLGGTALAKGRGEILKTLPEFPDCEIVVVKPDFSISTPELFKAVDSIKLKMHPDTKGIILALENQDLGGICRRLYNVFEDVPDRRMKTVAEIKKELLQAGALGSIMTGTGSAVYGVFENGTVPAELEEILEKKYGLCHVARPVEKLI